MIITGAFGIVVSILSALLSALPSLSLPSWLSGTASAGTACDTQWTGCVTIGDYLHAVGYQIADKFGGWIDGDVLVSAVGFVAAAVAVGLGIRLARVAISLFTGGGGSAA